MNGRIWIFALSPVGLALLLAACSERAQPPETPSTNSQAQATVSKAPKPELVKLVGKWERPDGGYVLHLKSVDSEGKYEAGYFNPGPIHVAKALGIQEGTLTKLFVELRDVNYPGCTYSLTYDPQTDQLYGQYFQAAAQQTYDIAFGRLKE